MLLVGYGNTLRSDDGAGVRAAEELHRRIPGSDLLLRQELQLELAETMAAYDDVFFLDASGTGSRDLEVLPVTPDETVLNTGSHTCTPGALLALCLSLYGRRPERATLVTIPAETFEFGETLSPLSRRAVAACVERVVEMAGR